MTDVTAVHWQGRERLLGPGRIHLFANASGQAFASSPVRILAKPGPFLTVPDERAQDKLM